MSADAIVDPAAAATPAPPVRCYRMIVAYDGTLFHGWQKQEPPGQPPLRTVAGAIEEAIARTLGQRVHLVGSSRTDAGVHARGQVAQFDAATRIPVERLAEAINSRLPEDVDVLSVRPAAPTFDCIKQAVTKQYRYRIFNSTHRPLALRHHTWHCWWNLDLGRMNDAAARLVGEHDFAGFAAADHGRESTVRTIHRCVVERHELETQGPEDDPLLAADPGVPWTTGEQIGNAQASAGVSAPEVGDAAPSRGPAASEVHLVIQGSGFLYNMVRIIAGTLVEVGRGHVEPAVVERVLAMRDRRLAGPTLPPHGLWLEWIRHAGKEAKSEERRAKGEREERSEE